MNRNRTVLAVLVAVLLAASARAGSYVWSTTAPKDAVLQRAMDLVNADYAAQPDPKPTPYPDLQSFSIDVCEKGYTRTADWALSRQPTSFCDKWLSLTTTQQRNACTTLSLPNDCAPCGITSSGGRVGGGAASGPPVLK